MHLDWERMSLSGYFEALEAHNAAHDPEAGKRQPASPEFRDQMQRIFASEKKGAD